MDRWHFGTSISGHCRDEGRITKAIPRRTIWTRKTPPKNSGTRFTRRAVTAASVAALVVPRHVLGGPGYQAPSDTVRIAGVGVGGMGRRYIEGCGGERIVALCDVDHSFAAPVFRKYP